MWNHCLVLFRNCPCCHRFFNQWTDWSASACNAARMRGREGFLFLAYLLATAFVTLRWQTGQRDARAPSSLICYVLGAGSALGLNGSVLPGITSGPGGTGKVGFILGWNGSSGLAGKLGNWGGGNGSGVTSGRSLAFIYSPLICVPISDDLYWKATPILFKEINLLNLNSSHCFHVQFWCHKSLISLIYSIPYEKTCNNSLRYRYCVTKGERKSLSKCF